MATENKTTEIKTTKAAAAKEKMVKIRIPRTRDNDADEYVSIGSRNWVIKRGVEVEVPECVAILLNQREEAREEAYDRQNALKKN